MKGSFGVLSIANLRSSDLEVVYYIKLFANLFFL